MNSLIVLAHPEPSSFNAELARAARQTLRAQGHEVRISDLYATAFAADEHGRHYVRRKDVNRFDAQMEQRFSATACTLPADVQREIEALLRADLLILQFPLWWFGMPALLKGWMDRVFVHGRLYSSSRRLDTGVCRGKRAMLSVTTGSSAQACSHDGQEGDTRLILWPIHYALHYTGFTVLEPTVINGARGGLAADTAALQALSMRLQAHCMRLANLDAIPALAFNSAQDWDEHGKLRPHAPVHSPFIRRQSNWKLEEP